MDKQTLLAELQRTGDDFAARLRSASEAWLDEGCYEQGWSRRQLAAHLSSMEWTYPRLIDIARDAASAPPPSADESPPTRQMSGGNDAYNARQVERRADWTTAQILEEFERNRKATIDAVQATPDDLLAVRIRSAGGITGTLAEVMHGVAVVHVQQHVADLEGAS